MRHGKKSSISKARSYKEIGEFWDTHDLGDYWDQTKPVEFEVDIKSEAVYYAIEPKLSAKISRIREKTRRACGDSVESVVKRKAGRRDRSKTVNVLRLIQSAIVGARDENKLLPRY